jgi:altronate dehydratase
MRFRLGAAMLVLSCASAIAQPAATCEQAAFASLVSEASAKLATMNEDNKKAFQVKLASLKAREGWTDGEYAAKATPFVKDATTASLDEGNKSLLDKVPQLGGGANLEAGSVGGSDLAGKRCAMLEELRTLMAKLVENTKAKWAHMLAKLDAALEVSRQAKAAAGQ